MKFQLLVITFTILKSEIKDVLQGKNIKCKNIIITTKITSVIISDIDILIEKKGRYECYN